jgi:hypothetical protein
MPNAGRTKNLISQALTEETLVGTVVPEAITGLNSTLPITGKTGVSSAGGSIPITGGAGNGSTNAGGAVPIVGGAGAAGGAGGAVSQTGGAPASGNANGGAASSIGGAGSGTGTGGAATLRGGASAGASGTAGAATVDAGAATGGTAAAVNIGTANASAVNLGKASSPTNILGTLKATPGASTAAAGSDSAGAGALPAGTASVYPTTAADDTKGVRLHASDEVTGNLKLIGNGVSNKILKVYPPTGGTINGAAADAAFSSVSGKGVIVYCLDATAHTWLAW